MRAKAKAIPGEKGLGRGRLPKPKTPTKSYRKGEMRSPCLVGKGEQAGVMIARQGQTRPRPTLPHPLDPAPPFGWAVRCCPNVTINRPHNPLPTSVLRTILIYHPEICSLSIRSTNNPRPKKQSFSSSLPTAPQQWQQLRYLT